jgi:hypothetical protein
MGEHRRLKLQRREHRKRKQEDKRRAAAALAPVPSKPGDSPSTAPMSDVLERVARPLLDTLPDDSGINRVRAVMLLAAVGWNAAVGSSPEQVDTVLQELSLKFAETSRELSKIAPPFIQMLAERKRQLFPHDDRLVLDVEVADRGDHFYITAASMRWPHGGAPSVGPRAQGPTEPSSQGDER